jgi:ActR/RegA family two-component response regulator
MENDRPTILLVDDDEQFLNSLAERVRLRGFEPLTAANVSEAVELAQANRIHVAVVDLRLPDSDGLVAITRLKEIHPEIRTILLTAYGDNKLREATQSLNSAYFEKQDMGSFWEFLADIPFRRIRILLVDDDEAFLGTLAERIRLRGYDPLTAINVGDALDLARTNKIHVAVVDQRLPDMDGLVAITKLKEIHPGIETVLLTAYGDDKLREATEALNSAYFEKEDMGSFWGFVRGMLRKLETTMAAAGMATGGDLDDAVRIADKDYDGE